MHPPLRKKIIIVSVKIWGGDVVKSVCPSVEIALQMGKTGYPYVPQPAILSGIAIFINR